MPITWKTPDSETLRPSSKFSEQVRFSESLINYRLSGITIIPAHWRSKHSGRACGLNNCALEVRTNKSMYGKHWSPYNMLIKIIVYLIDCILYSAFLDTQSALHSVCVCVGGDMTPHPLPVCSTHLGDARQPVCARTLTTHWLSGEVRKWN